MSYPAGKYKGDKHWNCGNIPWNKGKAPTAEMLEHLRLIAKERQPSYGMLGKTHSQEAKEKISKVKKGQPLTWRTSTMGFQPGHPQFNTGRTYFKSGPEHPDWIDGRAAGFHRSAEYRRWRRAIDKRDKTCQSCGADQKLEAHHINGRANTLKNGILLCQLCHIAIHKAILSQVSGTPLKGAETIGEVQSS